jgi:membrane-associated phospholipid phosphatase
MRVSSDEKDFWSSTPQWRHADPKTVLPWAALAGLTFASDPWISRQVPDAPSQLRRSHTVSQIGVFSLIGAAGGAWVWGRFTRNDHLQETGVLSAEAMLNSTAITWTLKEVTQRQRPIAGGGTREFFQGGNSFPSEHSALAWSAASVLAHEYPGTLTQLAAYGLASAVTMTRVTSKEHFASDVVIGSALGWYVGRQVYRKQHNPELGGAPWGDLMSKGGEVHRSPENMGSPYVPMESWVYPAFDRLAALGYTQTAFAGLRPWTRMECARLLDEADESLRYDGDSSGEVSALIAALGTEFSREIERRNGGRNLDLSVDSVYARATAVSGATLNDGFHFGQTLINDHGRPYGEGFNSIAGITAHAVAGPFAFFVQGEYQQAPSVPGYSSTVQQAIAAVDLTTPISNARDAIQRFRLLDAYVSYTFHNYQLSFGKQSLWLGPGDGGPFLFSDNAEPIPMLRISRVSPERLPSILGFLGPVRHEFFLGQLSGHRFVFGDPTLYGPNNISPQPFIQGHKISFKPTRNMELGFSFTAVFGGPGLPFTWRNFLRTFRSSNGEPGTRGDPGDRRGAFDFSYRIPRLRKWLTFYVDSLTEDDVSPVQSTRPALHPGVYFPQIPRIPKLEVRLEGVYTAIPNLNFGGGGPIGYYYYNGRYRSGYTNNGYLLANWIGRQGRGGQGWATYSFSPRNKIQFSYRNATADRAFLQGGHLHDIDFRTELAFRHDVTLSGMLQYERWRFPLLASGWQNNVTSSIQLTFTPRWRAH